jgi:peptidyl-prolyl cis-trans isomerase SurA
VITPVREAQIANRQNDDAASPEAAARKVKMIADKLQAGAQFSELAMDYSEDPQTAPQGGDLGLVSATQLRQAAAPLRDAVLKAQPGTVSQVSIGGGYTLVLVAAKEAAGQRDLTSPGVRDSISAALRDRQQQLLQTAFLAVVRNDAQVLNLLAKQVVSQTSRPPTLLPTPPGKKQP